MLTKEVGIFKVFKISCRKFCFKGNHPAFLKIFFFYKKMFFSCSCRGGENCRGFNQKIKFWTSLIIKIFNFFCCKGYSKKKISRSLILFPTVFSSIKKIRRSLILFPAVFSSIEKKIPHSLILFPRSCEGCKGFYIFNPKMKFLTSLIKKI